MKKNTSPKKCLVCNARLPRMATTRYTKQYCDEHKRDMDKLRAMRQPCSIIGCKNPAHEDGYCDSCRPFDADFVPLRTDWLSGVGKIDTNQPTYCTTCGFRDTVKGSARCGQCSESISEIRKRLR